MQTTFGVIMLALVGGEPRVLTLKQMLEEYIKYQKEIITRRTRFELSKARERAHIFEALKVAVDFIDEVISIIRSSKDVPESKDNLMERFGFDDVQADAIVKMTLGRLSGLERQKIEDELAALPASPPSRRFWPTNTKFSPSSRMNASRCGTNTAMSAVQKFRRFRARWISRT